MTILPRLASSLQRRDEVPNQLLAEEIVRANNRTAVTELVANLENKNRKIQHDCIKVLYEIGERRPGLIAGNVEEFAALLTKSNNRLVWGGMTALHTIAGEDPDGVCNFLPQILAAAKGDSVIARDHAVGILVKLGSLKRYAARCLPLLLAQLKTCPNNQLPMYAEMAAPVVTKQYAEQFCRVLTSRLRGLEKESQKKRVARVLKKTAA